MLNRLKNQQLFLDLEEREDIEQRTGERKPPQEPALEWKTSTSMEGLLETQCGQH